MTWMGPQFPWWQRRDPVDPLVGVGSFPKPSWSCSMSDWFLQQESTGWTNQRIKSQRKSCAMLEVDSISPDSWPSQVCRTRRTEVFERRGDRKVNYYGKTKKRKKKTGEKDTDRRNHARGTGKQCTFILCTVRTVIYFKRYHSTIPGGSTYYTFPIGWWRNLGQCDIVK